MDQFLYHFARVLIASKLAPKNCIPHRAIEPKHFSFLHPQASHSALSRTETQNFLLHFWVLLVLIRWEMGIKNVFVRFKVLRMTLEVT